MIKSLRYTLLIALFLAFLPTPVRADWTPLIERLVADKFDEREMRILFTRPGVAYYPGAMTQKITVLVNNRFKKTEEVAVRKSVYTRFLEPSVIADARLYMQQNRKVLIRIMKNYCVPQEIIVSIVLVETGLGRNLGKNCAFNILASMALSSSLETIRPYLAPDLITAETEDFAKTRCRQKADWAYEELKALIKYASMRGLDPLTIPGSMYGAIGICQFMPSNIFSYGVDADKDGHIDLFSQEDALYSIANYLRSHGWKCSISKKRQRRIIMAYNPSDIYVNTVMGVADMLKRRR